MKQKLGESRPEYSYAGIIMVAWKRRAGIIERFSRASMHVVRILMHTDTGTTKLELLLPNQIRHSTRVLTTPNGASRTARPWTHEHCNSEKRLARPKTVSTTCRGRGPFGRVKLVMILDALR